MMDWQSGMLWSWEPKDQPFTGKASARPINASKGSCTVWSNSSDVYKRQLYEIGAEYIPQGENELPIETDHLTLGLYGDKADFYAIKGAVEALLDYLNIQDVDVEADSTNPTFHPGRCAVITAGGEELGVVGEVHPLVAENYEIGTRVYLAKLSMDALFAHTPADKEYKALPKYPASQRDIALLCNEELPVLTMETVSYTHLDVYKRQGYK